MFTDVLKENIFIVAVGHYMSQIGLNVGEKSSNLK